MRYFLLFLLCVGSSTVFCASGVNEAKSVSAILGQRVEVSIARELEKKEHAFNPKTEPGAKIAYKDGEHLKYGQVKKVYLKTKYVAILNGKNKGCLLSFEDVRSLKSQQTSNKKDK